MKEVGYDPTLFGVVQLCDCGHRMLFPTDLMLEGQGV